MWWREHAAVHTFSLVLPRLCRVLVGCVGSAFPVLVTGTGLCVCKQSLGGCQWHNLLTVPDAARPGPTMLQCSNQA